MRKKFEKDAETSLDNSSAGTSEELTRFRKAMEDGKNDDASEGLPGPSKRIHRDSRGRLPPKLKSVIRDAILEELGNREITRYQLWKLAKNHCATIPESAVYEFLRGQRHLGLEYVEALIAALGLVVVHPSHAA
ncbi:MAG TPA: hypothetical protein VGQ99_17645 [Tepidisphaeraceae bacterium]|nr:hypothetical protein [Tepidisphaeraceae bacterium]